MILKDEGGEGGDGWEPNTETSGSVKPEHCGAPHSQGSLSAFSPSTASWAEPWGAGQRAVLNSLGATWLINQQTCP